LIRGTENEIGHQLRHPSNPDTAHILKLCSEGGEANVDRRLHATFAQQAFIRTWDHAPFEVAPFVITIPRTYKSQLIVWKIPQRVWTAFFNLPYRLAKPLLI
jgi:hypothetical protein